MRNHFGHSFRFFSLVIPLQIAECTIKQLFEFQEKTEILFQSHFQVYGISSLQVKALQ